MSTIKIITDWDPQNLMSHAPDDEYSYEAKRIEECLISIDGEVDLAKVIHQVFFEQFDDDFIKSAEECFQIAKQIILSDNIIKAKVNNKKVYLIEGNQYRFRFKDSDISFDNMNAEVMDTHWIDSESGKSYFYIHVNEQAEDYLISDDELLEVHHN